MTDNSTSSANAYDRCAYADLKGADLSSARLDGASLTAADLRGAERGYAYWWARTAGPIGHENADV